MNHVRSAAMAFIAVAALLSTMAPTLAKPDHARFSAAPVNSSGPALATTLSMVEAGGGPAAFDAKTLVGVLAGDKTAAEVASLQKKFGADNVTSFLEVFNFVVNDSLAKVTAAKVVLPAQPVPAPSDGKALAAALYTLGIDPATNTFDVEYMLDGLVTHPIHVAVMDDIDAKYGEPADANYHAVLRQAMLDLKTAYGL